MKSRQLDALLFALTFAVRSSLVQAGPTFYRLHALLNFTREDILMMKRAALIAVLALCAASVSGANAYEIDSATNLAMVPAGCDGGVTWVEADKLTIASDSGTVNWTIHYTVDPPSDGRTCVLRATDNPVPGQPYAPDHEQYQCHLKTTYGETYDTVRWHAVINKHGKAKMTCHLVRGDCGATCHARSY